MVAFGDYQVKLADGYDDRVQWVVAVSGPSDLLGVVPETDVAKVSIQMQPAHRSRCCPDGVPEWLADPPGRRGDLTHVAGTRTGRPGKRGSPPAHTPVLVGPFASGPPSRMVRSGSDHLLAESHFDGPCCIPSTLAAGLAGRGGGQFDPWLAGAGAMSLLRWTLIWRSCPPALVPGEQGAIEMRLWWRSSAG